jgi:hypothetical protein
MQRLIGTVDAYIINSDFEGTLKGLEKTCVEWVMDIERSSDMKKVL